MSTDLERRLRDAFADDAERARLLNPDTPPVPTARPLPVDQHGHSSAWKLVAAAAAVALVAAAGTAVLEDRDHPRVTTSETEGLVEDQAVVDDAVLTPADMPLGWKPAPPELAARWETERAEVDQAFADCLGVEVSDVERGSATARSGFVNSYQENDERLVSEVTAFATESEARGATDRLRADAAQRCHLEAVEAQIAEAARDGVTLLTGTALSGDDVQVGESTIEVLFLEYLEGGSYREIGQDSVGLRLHVPLSLEGREVDVYAELALVRQGRFVVQMSFQTYFGAFDGDGVTSSALASQTPLRLMKKVLDRLPPDTSPATSEQPAVPVEELLVLPEAGEQPADPVAAEEQVRTAYVTLFDAARPREERARFVERPDVWVPANQSLAEGQYGEAVRDQRAEVDHIVFTSPTHAAVRFRLVASSELVPQGYRIGDAVLVDGRWLVAIGTPCDLIAMAGISCSGRTP